ncbi:rCG49692 [Rattus norvegicus]|uniref:RCG49692 n=1 Tax=Rattus norvegicus TaxID=10116 RepID=A6K2C8_RAT|nr:rCG49692 [Rattus norvegicus]
MLPSTSMSTLSHQSHCF